MARMREVASRVFAVEYNRSHHEDKGVEENAPNYVITPLGSMVNRLFVVGVMMSKLNTGTEDSPAYRAEIRDPTGTFYLYAGQYNPQALTALAQLEPPTLLGVVGKVKTFTKEDGSLYLSVKPEVVFPVDIPQRDRWIVSTCRFTMEKVKALKDAMGTEGPTVEGLMAKGHPRRASESAVRSIELYGSVETEPMIEGVKQGLRLVIEGGGRSLGEEMLTVQSMQAVKEAVPSQKTDPDLKDRVLEIIKELSKEKGALYRDIIKSCEKGGIDKVALEETVQELLDEGLVYEPTIGIIKPI